MQNSLLTFVVPVRHQANAVDWPKLKQNLIQTARSIAGQTDPRWQAVVVANHGADLPDLPDGFCVSRVDFPPNPLPDVGSGDLESVYEAFRLDKGRRVLAGLVATQPQGHVMIVDDDDFVSRRLTEFVAGNVRNSGWYVRDGYVWGDGGRLVYRYRDFSHLCGSSHIIRSDLYKIPKSTEDMSDVNIRRVFGSHRFMQGDLEVLGCPLDALPFAGAVYRIGHPGAHSRSSGLVQKYFDKSLIGHPREAIRRISRLRWVTNEFKKEFFGRVAG